MTRQFRVRLVWLALFTAYAIPVLVFEPFAALGWPMWLNFATGALIGLLVRLLAEWIVYRRELIESNRRFRAAWRKAMDDGKGKL